MGYFFTSKNSPLISRSSALAANEQDVAERIIAIRDAIGHRESPNNFANHQIKIVGGLNFKDEDVEVQYGAIKVLLLAEVLAIHRRYRELFAAAGELPWLMRHPVWGVQEHHLAAAERILREKLCDPARLLKSKSKT